MIYNNHLVVMINIKSAFFRLYVTWKSLYKTKRTFKEIDEYKV